MQANMQSHSPVNVANTSAPASTPQTDRTQCVWCDSKDHFRRECPEFSEALRLKRVGVNDRGRVVCNDEELPAMWGKGGMKRFLALATSTAVTAASHSNAATHVDPW